MCYLIPRLMFFRLFVCFFSFLLFRCPPPKRRSEVRDSSGAAAAGQRSGVLLKYFLCVQRMFWQPNWLQPPQESREEDFFFVFRAGKLFFFFSVAVVFVFLPRLTGIRQEVRREQEEELCLPRSSGDGRDLLSRPLICNRNLFVFLPPFYRPPQCCATCVTAEFCTTKLNQKERNGYMSLYIYIKKIYRYINATTKKTSGF